MTKRRKLVVTLVGAGSTRTPGIVGSLIELKERFPLKELILYDIDRKRMEVQEDYLRLVLKEHYPDLKLVITDKDDEIYDHCDFVFVQMRVGGFEMRAQDERIPLKYGLIGQETCGPGGFAYGLRSIGPMIEMVKKVRAVNSDAWILNYTNPAAIVGLALSKVFPDDKKIIHMCDQPYSMVKSFGEILDVPMEDIDPKYFGLNHFGWFTHLYHRQTGEDLLPKLKAYLKNHDFKPYNAKERDKSWFKTYKNVSQMMGFFPEYFPNTYLQYYFFPEEIAKAMDPNFTRTDEARLGREKEVLDICKQVTEQQSLEGVEFQVAPVHGHMIVEIAESIAFNLKKVFVLMQVNHGRKIIPNLPEDVLIEVAGELTNQGSVAYPFGPVKTFYKGLIETQHAYEKLTVEAYLEQSYQKALQALTLNRSIGDPVKAKAVLDDLAEANKDYWQLY